MRLTTVKEENRAQAWDKPKKMLKTIVMCTVSFKRDYNVLLLKHVSIFSKDPFVQTCPNWLKLSYIRVTF